MNRIGLALALAALLLMSCNDAGCANKKERAPALVDVAASVSRQATSASSAPDGRCQRLCRTAGQCTDREGRCVADSAADCKKSFACFALGRCSLKDGACVPVSDEDCAGSQVCKGESKCFLVDGRCSAPVSATTDSG
jgi:hypothetical protein